MKNSLGEGEEGFGLFDEIVTTVWFASFYSGLPPFIYCYSLKVY